MRTLGIWRVGSRGNYSAKGKGKLVIAYNSLDELDGVLTRFGDLD